jgi:hypothetical protein
MGYLFNFFFDNLQYISGSNGILMILFQYPTDWSKFWNMFNISWIRQILYNFDPHASLHLTRSLECLSQLCWYWKMGFKLHTWTSNKIYFYLHNEVNDLRHKPWLNTFMARHMPPNGHCLEHWYFWWYEVVPKT